MDRQSVPLDVEQPESRKQSDARRTRQHPGGLIKTRADMLLHYFLDSDDLVTVPVFRLKQWAFGSGEEGGIYRFPEKRQGRYAQANDSWGRCVPVDVLEQEIGAKRAKVRQMSLFG